MTLREIGHSVGDVGRGINAAWQSVLDYPFTAEDFLFWAMMPISFVFSIWLFVRIVRGWIGVGKALTWRHRQNLGIAWRMFVSRRK